MIILAASHRIHSNHKELVLLSILLDLIGVPRFHNLYAFVYFSINALDISAGHAIPLHHYTNGNPCITFIPHCTHATHYHTSP